MRKTCHNHRCKRQQSLSSLRLSRCLSRSLCLHSLRLSRCLSRSLCLHSLHLSRSLSQCSLRLSRSLSNCASKCPSHSLHLSRPTPMRPCSRLPGSHLPRLARRRRHWLCSLRPHKAWHRVLTPSSPRHRNRTLRKSPNPRQQHRFGHRRLLHSLSGSKCHNLRRCTTRLLRATASPLAPLVTPMGPLNKPMVTLARPPAPTSCMLRDNSTQARGHSRLPRPRSQLMCSVLPPSSPRWSWHL
jgi:hypothetical protein